MPERHNRPLPIPEHVSPRGRDGETPIRASIGSQHVLPNPTHLRRPRHHASRTSRGASSRSYGPAGTYFHWSATAHARRALPSRASR